MAAGRGAAPAIRFSIYGYRVINAENAENTEFLRDVREKPLRLPV
jgi:hypothetical protein